ncbi:MAG: SURF1 family protein [Xanthomonadales bacterium]|nr:SURF1 family protein [Xanthomonadales bacterium]
MARRWTSPSWFALVLLAAGLAAFTTLGFWQLDRAREKEALLAAYAGAATRTPVALEEARRSAAGPLHPRVRVRGRYDVTRGYVLDDQVRDGRQGRFFYALFEPVGDERALLVNLGFQVRAGVADDVALPLLPRDEQELVGLYAPPPGAGLRLGGNALPAQAQWPKLTVYIDTAEIAQDLGRRVDERVLLPDADPASGFERAWTPQILPPERHRGYALQWFSFAVAAIVIFIVLHWRRVQPGPT